MREMPYLGANEDVSGADVGPPIVKLWRWKRTTPDDAAVSLNATD